MKSRMPELGTYGSEGVHLVMDVSTRQVRTRHRLEILVDMGGSLP